MGAKQQKACAQATVLGRTLGGRTCVCTFDPSHELAISHNFKMSCELGQDLTMVLTQGLVGMPGSKLRVQSPQCRTSGDRNCMSVMSNPRNC